MSGTRRKRFQFPSPSDWMIKPARPDSGHPSPSIPNGEGRFLLIVTDRELQAAAKNHQEPYVDDTFRANAQCSSCLVQLLFTPKKVLANDCFCFRLPATTVTASKKRLMNSQFYVGKCTRHRDMSWYYVCVLRTIYIIQTYYIYIYIAYY